jgi:hypothetical protein
MRLIRAIRSIIAAVDHWVHETYCRLGERLGERLEDASDRLAEERYNAERRPEPPAAAAVQPLQPAAISELRVINGHKHAD